MENRNGLLVGTMVTPADGTAERDAGLLMAEKIPGTKRVTLGGDKNYDTRDFVREISPIHLDIISETVGPQEYTKAIRYVMDKFGPPPFDTLLSANANPSTLENWGEDSWITLQQTGNMCEHNNYWYLTEIFHLPHPEPAINGEPYYSGYVDARGLGGSGYKYGASGGSERDAQFVRSSMYGSFLSGGFGGHVYGAEGIWGADIEPAAPIKMWDAFQWISGAQMKYLCDFAFSVGRRYQELEPDADMASPDKDYSLKAHEGWAYCARTRDKEIFLAYFEKGMPHAQIRGGKLSSTYQAEWFDPRKGIWRNAGTGIARSSQIGIIELPDFPGDTDWGLRLIYQNARTASGQNGRAVARRASRGWSIWIPAPGRFSPSPRLTRAQTRRGDSCGLSAPVASPREGVA